MLLINRKNIRHNDKYCFTQRTEGPCCERNMKEIIYPNFFPESERENVGKNSQGAVLICCVLVLIPLSTVPNLAMIKI